VLADSGHARTLRTETQQTNEDVYLRFNFKLAVVAGIAATAFAVSAGAAVAAIGVSTAPGTNAPPPTLAGYQMTPFG
jgi:hypothetical protein